MVRVKIPEAMFQFLFNKIITMKLMAITTMVVLFSCSQLDKSPTTKKPNSITYNLTGIWIPEKIEWATGDFDTYYFPDDSTAMIFSSVQKKIGDSIYFNTEEGFNLKKGTLTFISDSEKLIKAQTIYQFIKRKDSAGNEIKSVTSIILTLQKGTPESIQLNKIAFVSADKYTEESKKSIRSIATKMGCRKRF